MAVVVADMSVSVDGYVTGPNDRGDNPFGDGAGLLHDWFGTAATEQDRAILTQFMNGVGAVVMGRRSFQKNEGDGGWADGGPAGDVPCFVVTHQMPDRPYPAVFTFVTEGVASAIQRAQQAAGEDSVYLFGATVVQQALPLALVDRIQLHVVPCLIGGGTPLFGTLGKAIALRRTDVVITPAATHLTFRVLGSGAQGPTSMGV